MVKFSVTFINLLKTKTEPELPLFCGHKNTSVKRKIKNVRGERSKPGLLRLVGTKPLVKWNMRKLASCEMSRRERCNSTRLLWINNLASKKNPGNFLSSTTSSIKILSRHFSILAQRPDGVSSWRFGIWRYNQAVSLGGCGGCSLLLLPASDSSQTSIVTSCTDGDAEDRVRDANECLSPC